MSLTYSSLLKLLKLSISVLNEERVIRNGKWLRNAYRDVLFEFHLKFLNTASFGIPARSLLLTGQTAQPKIPQWYSNKTSLLR